MSMKQVGGCECKRLGLLDVVSLLCRMNCIQTRTDYEKAERALRSSIYPINTYRSPRLRGRATPFRAPTATCLSALELHSSLLLLMLMIIMMMWIKMG